MCVYIYVYTYIYTATYVPIVYIVFLPICPEVRITIASLETASCADVLPDSPLGQRPLWMLPVCAWQIRV